MNKIVKLEDLFTIDTDNDTILYLINKNDIRHHIRYIKMTNQFLAYFVTSIDRFHDYEETTVKESEINLIKEYLERGKA